MGTAIAATVLSPNLGARCRWGSAEGPLRVAVRLGSLNRAELPIGDVPECFFFKWQRSCRRRPMTHYHSKIACLRMARASILGDHHETSPCFVASASSGTRRRHCACRRGDLPFLPFSDGKSPMPSASRFMQAVRNNLIMGYPLA